MKHISFLFLLSIVLAGTAHAQDNKAQLLKEPASWTFERFALPPVFAPAFPYHGAEELRFSPGMFDKNSPQYFTYAFVAKLDDRNSISEAEVKIYLDKYFKGLCGATARDRKLVVDTSKINVSIKKIAAASKEIHYDAVLNVFGVFADGAPVTLNMEIKVLTDKASNKTYLVFIASPKAKSDAVWTDLFVIQKNFSIPAAEKHAAAKKYNLQELLKNDQFVTVASHEMKPLPGTKEGAITAKGINWIKGLNFTNGSIDIDLRGKNVFLQSFLGIAFRGTDTSTCDILYFRPFNFKHADTSRHKWSVAYMHIPDNNYAKLRELHPGVYENKVNPVPEMDDWFHATLVIKDMQLAVYVNHSDKPSLVVTMLGNRPDGLFGLYSDGLTNDFANLAIQAQDE